MLEKKVAYNQAAAIAVFNLHLHLQLAIDVLGRAPDEGQTKFKCFGSYRIFR